MFKWLKRKKLPQPETIPYLLPGSFDFQIDNISTFIASDHLNRAQKKEFLSVFHKATQNTITLKKVEKQGLKAAFRSYCGNRSVDELHPLLDTVNDQLCEGNPLKTYRDHLSTRDSTHLILPDGYAIVGIEQKMIDENLKAPWSIDSLRTIAKKGGKLLGPEDYTALFTSALNSLSLPEFGCVVFRLSEAEPFPLALIDLHKKPQLEDGFLPDRHDPSHFVTLKAFKKGDSPVASYQLNILNMTDQTGARSIDALSYFTNVLRLAGYNGYIHRGATDNKEIAAIFAGLHSAIYTQCGKLGILDDIRVTSSHEANIQLYKLMSSLYEQTLSYSHSDVKSGWNMTGGVLSSYPLKSDPLSSVLADGSSHLGTAQGPHVIQNRKMR